MDGHQSTNTKRPVEADLHRDTQEMERAFAGLETEDRSNDQTMFHTQRTVRVNAGDRSSTRTEGEVEMFKNMLKERMRELEEVRNSHFHEHPAKRNPAHQNPRPGDNYYVVLRKWYYPAKLRERLPLPSSVRESLSLPLREGQRLWLFPSQEYTPYFQVLLRGLDDFKISHEDEEVRHNISLLLLNPSPKEVQPYLLTPTSVIPTVSRGLAHALQGRTDIIILSHCCSLHTKGRDCELMEDLIRQLFFSPALEQSERLFENPGPETERLSYDDLSPEILLLLFFDLLRDLPNDLTVLAVILDWYKSDEFWENGKLRSVGSKLLELPERSNRFKLLITGGNNILDYAKSDTVAIDWEWAD